VKYNIELWDECTNNEYDYTIAVMDEELGKQVVIAASKTDTIEDILNIQIKHAAHALELMREE
jgi:hypothetical protein